ncbi:hypothetical protein [Gilvibacter sp. SZ-19]|uniref:hypothetical protein n=1 Tax=unclassified Gilvibacter TaxID=2625242 RepID=UPI000B3CDCF8|nr:hypothetical protein [Gilvibacter sp. SZ-19]ARV11905.1 hypothetical protein BTO09_05920 [Gilvibacter sp. SZ-19]
MNKTIHAELRELAQEILDGPKVLSAVDLKEKAQRLYEKLTILSHLEAQVGVDPLTTPVPDSESLDSKSYREQNWFTEPKPVEKPVHDDELVEPLIEKIKDIVAQMPEESQKVDALLEEVLPKAKYIKNDLEELAADYKHTPVFERKQETPPTPTAVETPEAPEAAETTNNSVDKPLSLNDASAAKAQIGLNDRIAFIKHLFDNKPEDYARVMSQLDTCDSFQQAQDFINGQVKPEYNYWLEKQEVAERFMSIIERRF